jgi:UrcA family protein
MLMSTAALTFASHALASETKIAYASDGTATTTVVYTDLDLSKPGDVQALYARVQEAAVAVCEPESRERTTLPSDWQKQCVRQAIERAVQGIYDKRLTAVHNAASHRVVRL